MRSNFRTRDRWAPHQVTQQVAQVVEGSHVRQPCNESLDGRPLSILFPSYTIRLLVGAGPGGPLCHFGTREP
jgi:hypothetical protein